jgi:hypothetical protein
VNCLKKEFDSSALSPLQGIIWIKTVANLQYF